MGREGSHCRTIAEACAFIDKAPKGNDLLEYIFGDLLETFTDDETKVLAALTYFNLPAKLKWIADMTDLPAQTYFLPPLTAKFIRARHPEAVTQTGDALTDRAYALAMQYGGQGSNDYEKFPVLDTEWDFISAALPRLLTGDNDRLQTVCDQLVVFLNFTGRWDQRIWFFEQAEARALAANDMESAGWLAYRAGYSYNLRNQPIEVLACAKRATEHWQESTSFNKAAAIQLRGIGHKLEKDYPAAVAAYHEALDIYRSIYPESRDVAIILTELADTEKTNKDYSAAERDFREALRIAKIIKNDEFVAGLTGSLAALALDREQWAEAESLAREALALAEKVGRQELIASDCHSLAKVLLKQSGKSDWQSDLQEALSPVLSEAEGLSRRAVEIFTRLRSPYLQSAQETLAEIERAVNSHQ